jgi:hypothetical protein
MDILFYPLYDYHLFTSDPTMCQNSNFILLWKHEKKPSNVGYFSKITKSAANKQPILPRELKNLIAFSMCPMAFCEIWLLLKY